MCVTGFGDKVLADGDVINIDVTLIVDGWYGDTSRMFYVGKPSLKAQKLVETTFEAMWRGSRLYGQVRRLVTLGMRSSRLRNQNDIPLFVIFCGHGLGRIFHDAPNVMHFGRKGQGEVLQEGMFFTIEPMINAGRFDVKIPIRWLDRGDQGPVAFCAV